MKSIPSSVWFLGSLLIGALFIGLLVIGTNNRIRENVSLPIDMVMYFDYRCPYCVAFESEVLRLEQLFGDKLLVDFKHFPIPVGENSVLLAYAAESARLQDKFRPYHDEVMGRMARFLNGELPIDALEPLLIAEVLELDLEKFSQDLTSEQIRNTVQEMRAEGSRVGVTGTPTIFIEGQKVNANNVQKVIEDLIKLAEESENQ